MEISRRRFGFLAGAGSVTAAAVAASPLPAHAAPGTLALAGPYVLDGSAARQVDDLGALRGATRGTLGLRFSATRGTGRQVLLSLRSPSTGKGLTFGLEKGNLFAAIDAPDGSAPTLTWPVRSDREGDLADGHPHYVAWSVGDKGTEISVGGVPVHWGTSQAFFDQVPADAVPLLGGEHDGQAVTSLFAGTIDQVSWSDHQLSETEIAALHPALDTAEKWTPMTAYAPSTALKNRLPEVAGIEACAEGTVHAEFQTTHTGLNTILSAGNTGAPSTNFTVAVKGGALLVEVRSNGTSFANFSVPGHWNDGKRHTVTVTVSATKGLVLYADGSQLERHTKAPFFASLAGMNGLWIGGNRDDSGDQWQFTGQIGGVKLFRHGLLEPEVRRLHGPAPTTTRALFDIGYAGSANYRIPCLLRTSRGTLIAAADQRRANPYDSPNDINLAIRRSTDEGRTFSDADVVLDYPGEGYDGASVIDSVLVEDRGRGSIVCVVDRFPGGVGQGQAVTGTGFTSDGEQILKDNSGASFLLKADGSVTTDAGTPTDYTVGADGAVTKAGAPAGNIHLKAGTDPQQSLLEARTSYLVMVRSTDDGQTWSAPSDLTHQVKADWMRFLGTGPGSGIQLRHGAQAGRLLVPVYFNNERASAGIYSSAVIFSDDGGDTWKLSTSPNDGRTHNGVTYTSRTLTVNALATHEPTVAELSDGRVVMLMRNPSGRILRSFSADGGSTWSLPDRLEAVPDVFSQPNALTWDPDGDGECLLFGNASRRYPGRDGRNGRGTGVIRRSYDGGDTWDRNRVFRPDCYVYNNLAQMGDGSIGLLWELEWDGIYFTQLPWSWLEDYGA
ncbi:MAG: sialidase family protein [Dermabacter sp.]|nr:sialidase family protein [Dermabacter sp.]